MVLWTKTQHTAFRPAKYERACGPSTDALLPEDKACGPSIDMLPVSESKVHHSTSDVTGVQG